MLALLSTSLFIKCVPRTFSGVQLHSSLNGQSAKLFTRKRCLYILSYERNLLLKTSMLAIRAAKQARPNVRSLHTVKGAVDDTPLCCTPLQVISLLADQVQGGRGYDVTINSCSYMLGSIGILMISSFSILVQGLVWQFACSVNVCAFVAARYLVG